MAMSNAEAETKAHTPLSFQTDTLLQMLPVEDKVHKKETAKKILYIQRVVKINLHN